MASSTQEADHRLARSAVAIVVIVAGVASAIQYGHSRQPGHASTAATPARTAVSVPEVAAEVGGNPAQPRRYEGPSAAPDESATINAPSPSPPSGAGALIVPEGGDAERAVVQLTNTQRRDAGCPPVTWDGKLARAATSQAWDMIRRDYFEHVSPDGSRPIDRAKAAGFIGGVGENLAVGYATPPDVVVAWMESPGHRANILNCQFTRIGVSYVNGVITSKNARGVWVQEFGVQLPGA